MYKDRFVVNDKCVEPLHDLESESVTKFLNQIHCVCMSRAHLQFLICLLVTNLLCFLCIIVAYMYFSLLRKMRTG